MTNEELDAARALEAQRLFDANHYSPLRDKMFWDRDAIIAAARLAREGWTPSVAVDPDWEAGCDMAADYEDVNEYSISATWFVKAIKRGRELERVKIERGRELERVKAEEVIPSVDPDMARAKELAEIYYWVDKKDFVYRGIKEGRERALVESKPGLNWKKYDGLGECPVCPTKRVLIQTTWNFIHAGFAQHVSWKDITHYAIITPPEDK